MKKKLLKYNEFKNDLFESVVKRGKDQQVFNYSGIINDLWRPIIWEAQDFQNIKFDLENNEDIEKKTIFFDQLLRKDQPVKTEINLVLCEAHGDWEQPVLYFKIEFTHDHFIHSNKPDEPEFVWDRKTDKRPKDLRLNYDKYCIIPGPEINNLREFEDGKYIAYDHESMKEAGIEEKDIKVDKDAYKKAWDWIEDLMERLSKERHKRLDVDEDGKDVIEPEISDVEESVSNGYCKCDNCDWTWEMEDDDDNPTLCHKCGYDDSIKDFDMVTLNKWKSETELSENLIYHLEKSIPVTESIFRTGSEAFFELLKETRNVFDSEGIELCDIDQSIFENTDIGKFAEYEGDKVPLDLPMEYVESIDEAEYKGRDVKLNYPKRGGSKKYYVYVKNPDTGNVNKIEFGDTSGLNAKVSDPEARKSFAARHKCKTKKDKMKAGYWACRINKYGHLWGGKTYPGYW